MMMMTIMNEIYCNHRCVLKQENPTPEADSTSLVFIEFPDLSWRIFDNYADNVFVP
jgi:hypothetical protein